MSALLEDENLVSIIRGEIEDNDLEEIGRDIMANPFLDKVELYDFGEPEEYQPLFHGISQSKSIHTIYMHNSCICEALLGVILGKSGESIKKLNFEECEVTVDVFAVASHYKKHLIELSFSECTFKLGKDMQLTKRAKVASFYYGLKLETLKVYESHLGSYGFNTVIRLFRNPNASLKKVCIADSLHDEWGHIFLNELKACKSLEELEYGDKSEQNLILFSSVLPDLTLRRFDLWSSYQLSVDAAKALSHGISQNKTLETLAIQIETNDEVVDEVMAILIPECIGNTSSLKTLVLHDGDYDIKDSGMMLLADILGNNSTLEELDLHTCFSISSIGWRALSRALRGSNCSLKKLSLPFSSIDDDGISVFGNDLMSNTTLEVLNLGCSRRVTPVGWIAFSRALGSPRSVLKELSAFNNCINDDVVVAYANELNGNANSQLKSLDLYSQYDDFDLDVTDIGWDRMMNLLCNTSSINATSSSNHTLSFLGHFPVGPSDDEYCDASDFDQTQMPREVFDLLQMNKDEDKKQVARKKVIKHHFSEDFDLDALIGSDLKILPRKISWFGRDSLGLSMVYSIIRTLPDLCQNE